MDYITPPNIARAMLAAGTAKARLPIKDLLIRGALAGAYLAVATSMSVTAAVQTGQWIVGALIFPFGLCLVVLLGTELITGSFAILPCAAMEGKDGADIGRMLQNWNWVFVANLLGSLLYAALFAIALTMNGAGDLSPVAKKLVAMAEAKTIGYAAYGINGLITVFVQAILCNWLVGLAVVAALCSTSTVGKIAAMWGPVTLFFTQGFEHTVVNMFVIPAGIMMGANVTVADWWVWNQIPVTAGNLVGGMVFTGLAIYMTHRPKETPALAVQAQPGEVEAGVRIVQLR